MPEDQGVNGDRWTEQASKLLKSLGWEKIADSNIDIEGTDGLKHGIDALFRYQDGYSAVKQGFFLEAKRYRTTSFRDDKIQDWVTALNKKIAELKRSSSFNITYPAMSDSNPQNGLLMMWFHDITEFPKVKAKIDSAMLSVKVPKAYKAAGTRLFIISNTDILRLASLVDAKMKWEQERTDNLSGKLQFYYPSSMAEGGATRELDSLGIEYIFSKFVVAKALERIGNGHRPSYVIFYFGDVVDIRSFISLKSALLLHNIISEEASNIYLYCYNRDDNTRKIAPDIETLFRLTPSTQFEMKSMNSFADLPDWMND